MTEQLLGKMFNMGVITTKKSLQKAEEITPSAICRRRLPVVLVRMKMAETMQTAVTFVEQGQVRVGPNVISMMPYIELGPGVTVANRQFRGKDAWLRERMPQR